MMAGRGEDVAGGPVRHIPVLARQLLEHLRPHEGGIFIDGTFGAGGHTRGMLDAGARVIGIDRDRNAIAGGFDLVEQAAGRLTLIEDRFSNLEHVAQSLGHEAVDGILLDIGVSSMQLDEADRGFSFRNDGPLDMRMGGEGPSAADLVNAAPEHDLSLIIHTLGEERFARNVARAIVKARAEARIDDHAAARRNHRTRRAFNNPATSIRRRARSRRCACSSTTSSASLSPRSPPRSGC